MARTQQQPRPRRAGVNGAATGTSALNELGRLTPAEWQEKERDGQRPHTAMASESAREVQQGRFRTAP
jgi:hypothetical protein